MHNKRNDLMIVYSKDILELLKNKGFSTYRIKKEKIFNQTQLQQLRENKLVTQDVLNRICAILDCQPGDLLEYVPDNEPETDTE